MQKFGRNLGKSQDDYIKEREAKIRTMEIALTVCIVIMIIILVVCFISWLYEKYLRR